MSEEKIKCVALMSGGLDSTLAAAVTMRQGVEVLGVFFYTGFCLDEHRRRTPKPGQEPPRNEALRAGSDLETPVEIIDISEEYMDILLHPKHGYGSAANPCIDCRVEMFRRAKDYMKSEGARFIISGEVMGQRPMTQKEHQLRLIAKESECEDILLRPLSAKRMKPTLPEREGWVDREKLYGFTGRGRSGQIALAKELGIDDYPQPAGGCCFLTDKNFANRLFDMYDHRGKDTLKSEDIALLKVGRHFRLSDSVKVIVGRNEAENDYLESFANGRVKLLAEEEAGATAIIDGSATVELTRLAAAITAHYGKGREKPSVRVRCVSSTDDYIIEVAPESGDLEQWRV